MECQIQNPVSTASGTANDASRKTIQTVYSVIVTILCREGRDFSLSCVCLVRWAELCTPKIHMLKSQPLVPQYVTIFGDRISKKEVKLKRGN